MMATSPRLLWMGLWAALLATATQVRAQAPAEDTRPLSPAQQALFETPHLQNVTRPGTLDYSYTRGGMADRVAVHVRQVNADGTKNLSFDYLSGPNQVQFPALDHFRGNPLLMLTLERDVLQMKEAVGLSTSYFRNKVRESFVTAATVRDATFTLDGAAVPAQEITVQPFAGDQRLTHIPSLQAKTYVFVLAPAVPGTLAEIRISTPADATMKTEAVQQRTVFTGVSP